MRQYFFAIFSMLGCAALCAILVQSSPDRPAIPTARSCTPIQDYPVQRLAENGDVGAMAYLGERLVTQGCNAEVRAQGMHYIEEAADAGHHDALAFLSARQATTPHHGWPISTCAALLAMVMQGMEEPDLMPGDCE